MWPLSLPAVPTLHSHNSGPTEFTLPELLSHNRHALGSKSLGHSSPGEILRAAGARLALRNKACLLMCPHNRTRPSPWRPPSSRPGPSRSLHQQSRVHTVPGQALPRPCGPLHAWNAVLTSSPSAWTSLSRSFHWLPQGGLGALLWAPLPPQPYSLHTSQLICQLPTRPAACGWVPWPGLELRRWIIKGHGVTASSTDTGEAGPQEVCALPQAGCLDTSLPSLRGLCGAPGVGGMPGGALV